MVLKSLGKPQEYEGKVLVLVKELCWEFGRLPTTLQGVFLKGGILFSKTSGVFLSTGLPLIFVTFLGSRWRTKNPWSLVPLRGFWTGNLLYLLIIKEVAQTQGYGGGI